MTRKSVSFVLLSLLLTSLVACNLPARQTTPTPSTETTITIQQDTLAAPTPTPTSLCANPYFPSRLGDAWEYAGSNTAVNSYTRTDKVTNSTADAFTVSSELANISYTVNYACSAAGLTATDPVQQYAGALLSGANAPMKVNITSNTGISLPPKIAPGDAWQQTADFDATSDQLNLSGRFVFDYTAVGFENVTVPYGTFKALRVDATIRIEVSGFHILAGTYTSSTWMVTDIGVVKSEGTSHVPGIDFSDSMQLTSYTAAH